MSHVLKIMSGQNLADSDPQKNFDLFSIVPGARVSFQQNSMGLDVAIISNPESDSEEFIMHGNAYLMGESGKTIAHKGTNTPATLDKADENDAAAIVTAALKCCDVNQMKRAFSDVAGYHPEIFEAMSSVIHNYANPIVGEYEAIDGNSYEAAKQAIAQLTPKERYNVREDKAVEVLRTSTVDGIYHVLGEVARNSPNVIPAVARMLSYAGEPLTETTSESEYRTDLREAALAHISKVLKEIGEESLGKILGNMQFGEVTAFLWHAGQSCKHPHNRFIAAVGEYLANMAGNSDAEAMSAIMYAASHMPGVPKNEKAALNKGRSGEFPVFGTPANLAKIQNEAALTYHVTKPVSQQSPSERHNGMTSIS